MSNPTDNSDDNSDDKKQPAPKRLPYKATTASGNQFDFEFALHPETASPVHVVNLLSEILGGIDREIRLQGQVGNGDVLQAMCMAIAVRARMLGGKQEPLRKLAQDLLDVAFEATVEGAPGNIAPGAGGPIH